MASNTMVSCLRFAPPVGARYPWLNRPLHVTIAGMLGGIRHIRIALDKAGRRELARFVGLFALLFLATTTLWASDDNSLEAARSDYALHFFSAEAHVRLAKVLYDKGDRLQAFYVLEAARRDHFPSDQFDRAFRRIFRGDEFDNSPAAEAGLRNRVAKAPNDFEALTKLADIYISREDYQKAEPLLVRAGRVRPDDYSTVQALLEIYRITGQDNQAKATEYLWLHAHPGSEEWYATQIEKATPDKGAALVKEGLARYPKSAVLHYDRGALLHRANDLPGAEQEFTRAAELEPNSALIQGWMARFYLKSMNDLPRAFDHYLKAYFLDPDFYDTEYAESRIRKIANQLSEATLEQGPPPEGKTDPLIVELRPAVMGLILDALNQQWEGDPLPMLVDLLHDDDESNRWNAMQLIAAHAGSEFEPQLSRLLEDPNLCARGMAGYIAMKRWHERALPILQKWLEDPAALIRFDAISALAMDGGAPGRKIVERYAADGREPDERLRELLPQILAEQQSKPDSPPPKPK